MIFAAALKKPGQEGMMEMAAKQSAGLHPRTTDAAKSICVHSIATTDRKAVALLPKWKGKGGRTAVSKGRRKEAAVKTGAATGDAAFLSEKRLRPR